METPSRNPDAHLSLDSLAYASLAALAYAISAWGLDWWILSRAHFETPLPLAWIFSISLLILFGLAALITARFHSPVLGGVTWFIAAALVSAGQLFANTRLVPRLTSAPYAVSPWQVTDISITFSLLAIFCLSALFFGTLQLILLQAISRRRLFLPLVFVGLAFFLVGWATDAQIQSSYRQSVTQLDGLLETSLAYRGQTVERTLARQLGLPITASIAPALSPDRRLAYAWLSPNIVRAEIFVQLTDGWALCVVNKQRPILCARYDAAP